MHQGASQKYRLLLKLLFSRPRSFLTGSRPRLKEWFPHRNLPPEPGLDLAAMLDLSSKYLGMDLNGFLHDPDAVAIREHIAAERALLEPAGIGRHA